MCKEVICKSSGRRFWGLGSCSESKFQNQDPKHRSFQTTQFPETLHAKSKTVERSDGKIMSFFFFFKQTHQTVRTLHGTSHRGMFILHHLHEAALVQPVVSFLHRQSVPFLDPLVESVLTAVHRARCSHMVALVHHCLLSQYLPCGSANIYLFTMQESCSFNFMNT